MSKLTKAVARWLSPDLAEKADRYDSLISRMSDNYWWLGEFPDAQDTVRHYLDSEHNRWRSIGEPPRGDLPDDINGFREHLRRQSAARAVLALVQPAIDAAVAAERERCAGVVEYNQLMHTSSGDVLVRRSEGNRNGLAYAAAIRKG